MKILIVEDNDLQRKLLEEVMVNEGFVVTSVESGDEAVKMLGIGHFDLIISDLNMPRMDGYTLAKIVKGDEKKKHIPFLLYSAKHPPDEETLELAKRYGVDKYVMKAGVYGIVNEVIDYLK